MLMQEPVPPLSFLRAKPIGAMRMIDCGEEDDKIIAGVFFSGFLLLLLPVHSHKFGIAGSMF